MSGPLVYGSLDRGYYVYTDDYGNVHRINQRAVCAVAVGNVVSTDTSKSGRPPHWKLRHIHASYNDGAGNIANKRIVIGDPTSDIWTGVTTTLTGLDGQTWKIEGKIGERRT